MGVSEAYKEFIQELFAGFAPVTIRNMFGGGGVFMTASCSPSLPTRRFI